MKVQHTKTGRVAEVLSQDTKQVRIRFEDGTEQGMIPLTFKRWWKALDEENPMEEHIENVEVKEVKPVDDDKCGDGTPLAEVGKEILEQAKVKAEQVKKEKAKKKAPKVKKPSVKFEERVQMLTDFCDTNKFKYKLQDKVLKVTKNNGKLLHIYVGAQYFSIKVTEKNVPEGKTANKVRNCPLSHVFEISYDNLEEIKDFM